MATLKNPIEGFDRWITFLESRSYSPRTIKTYGYRIMAILGQIPKPTPFDIEDYFAGRIKKGYSRANLNIDHKALKSFFNYLQRRGLVKSDPMDDIEAPGGEEKKRDPASMVALEKVLKACDEGQDYTGKTKLMVVLLMDTGLRVLEAVTIELANVDLEKAEIMVMGKAKPRKGPRPRVVPISPVTVKLIREYIEDMLPYLHRIRGGNPKYLFPNGNENGYWHPGDFRQTLSRLCKRIGVAKITPHQIRHAFATQMLNAGAQMRMVSRILGHSDVGITDRIYGHVTQEQLDDEHRRFSPMADKGD